MKLLKNTNLRDFFGAFSCIKNDMQDFIVHDIITLYCANHWVVEASSFVQCVGQWVRGMNLVTRRKYICILYASSCLGCWVPKLISSSWNYYIRCSRAALWLFEVRTNLKHKDFKIYKLMGMSVINVLHPTFSFQMA